VENARGNRMWKHVFRPLLNVIKMKVFKKLLRKIMSRKLSDILLWILKNNTQHQINQYLI